MTGLDRTLTFLKGGKTDSPPFHPIIMRWAARYAGINYRDFCLDPHSKCTAMLKCAKDFGIDWVTVMSDPWAEASAFGIEVFYPENDLPIDKGGHMKSAQAAALLTPFDPFKNSRCINRIVEISEFKKLAGNELFIVGWVEGPVAEYVDLRRANEASVDFLTEPESVETAMDIITESALRFISLQIEAGAHCIGIGDAFCSQIGPELYSKFAFERERKMVDQIHKYGAIAKLHICGNTESILPEMINTGADIIDIDHLVSSMSGYARLLSPHQVLCGKADPVTIIQEGNRTLIERTILNDTREADYRCIVSAGCEITPGTSIENMRSFSEIARTAQKN